jgi:hypothetical protein
LRGELAFRCYVCIAFSRNAGPHSLVACYSVFKDRAPSPEMEPSSNPSLDCLAGVAKTTDLLQGGRRIYYRRPGSSRGISNFFNRWSRLVTAEGRCLHQPPPPVKSVYRVELCIRSCEGRDFYPSSEHPVKHLGDFFLRRCRLMEACCCFRRVPLKQLGDFVTVLLARGRLLPPPRGFRQELCRLSLSRFRRSSKTRRPDCCLLRTT